MFGVLFGQRGTVAGHLRQCRLLDAELEGWRFGQDNVGCVSTSEKSFSEVFEGVKTESVNVVWSPMRVRVFQENRNKKKPPKEKSKLIILHNERVRKDKDTLSHRKRHRIKQDLFTVFR